MFTLPPRTAPTLETTRLRLRAYTRNDFEDYHALWANETVVRHIGGKPFTRGQCWERLMQQIGCWHLAGIGYWAVIEKSSGNFIGEVGFGCQIRDIEPSIEGYPEAGWVFAPSAHGKGYATEAMRCALRWGLPLFGETRTVCIMDDDYAATRRVAEKLGFTEYARATFRGDPTLILELTNPALALGSE